MNIPVKILNAAILVCLCFSGCKGDGHIRGEISPSTDGKTYFAVLDDAGGYCASISLDGVIWEHPTGVYFEIEPGDHTINCGTDPGGEISFVVPSGVKFGFDYWGP
jgi:hypothetical protein